MLQVDVWSDTAILLISNTSCEKHDEHFKQVISQNKNGLTWLKNRYAVQNEVFVHFMIVKC